VEISKLEEEVSQLRASNVQLLSEREQFRTLYLWWLPRRYM